MGFNLLLSIDKDEGAIGADFYSSLIPFESTRMLWLRLGGNRLWLSRPVASGPKIPNESRWDSEAIKGWRGTGVGRPFEFGPRNSVNAEGASARRKAAL